MINLNRIHPGATVATPDDKNIAVISHMVGSDQIMIKLVGNDQTHLIPLEWVIDVSDRVYINRSFSTENQKWSSIAVKTPPIIKDADFRDGTASYS